MDEISNNKYVANLETHHNFGTFNSLSQDFQTSYAKSSSRNSLFTNVSSKIIKDTSKLDCLKNLTILYVEDEPEAREIFYMALEDYVGNIVVASNGAEALKLYQNQKIDLIFTDILMPKMNGIELATTIKNMQNADVTSTPIIFVTAFTDTDYLLASIKLHCSGYITKPINIEELLGVAYNAMLPKIQLQELLNKDILLDFLNVFVGGKKIKIIEYILLHCDSQHIFYGSYNDIATICNTTRQTVAKTFQQLIDSGLLTSIKNKTYHVHIDISKLRLTQRNGNDESES